MNKEQIQQLIDQLQEEVDFLQGDNIGELDRGVRFGYKEAIRKAKQLLLEPQSATPIQGSVEIAPLTDEQIDYLMTEGARWPSKASDKTIDYCITNFQEGVKAGYQQAIDNIIEVPQGSKELKRVDEITDEDAEKLSEVMGLQFISVERTTGNHGWFRLKMKYKKCPYEVEFSLSNKGHCFNFFNTRYDPFDMRGGIPYCVIDFLRSRNYNIPNQYK